MTISDVNVIRTIRLPILLLAAGAAAACASAPVQTVPVEQIPSTEPPSAQVAGDPRVGLRAGLTDAGEAILNMRHVSHRPRPTGFYNPQAPGDLNFGNTDLAFRGNDLIVGNFSGFQVWDITDPANPRLRSSVVCPGGQGDVSVHGNLVFMSVEQPRGRIDCGPNAPTTVVSAERFRGVRIFDISSVESPRQVAAIQTCRGSHTHSLVSRPGDDANVYVYVAGAAGVRPAEELEGCYTGADDPRTALFRIEVIRVPVAAPQQAVIVSEPRIFADEAGNIAGLWQGGDHGPETQRTATTNHCHDITAYPEIGLAAGACSGNGILLDIRDPAAPNRVDQVVDPNFAYWHSATFNNDGTKVIFTDEWGGGTQPRCRATDLPQWGANAIFDIVDGRMQLASYYKLPAAQTATENCVAHNGSLVPIPGRDVMIQAWYQGGISLFDWTDASNPVEIGFHDRGPIDANEMGNGGSWSVYWYNGVLVSSEIGRGLDIFELVPSGFISQNEIDASKTVRLEEFNPQGQPRFVWPPSFSLARAYVDQLERSQGLGAGRIAGVRTALAAAERVSGAARATALVAIATEIDAEAASSRDAAKVRTLAGALRELAAR
jgi:hypothetical protein